MRDLDGRTYVAATVDLPSLQVSALALTVAMASSSGSRGLEAAAVVGDADGIAAADLDGEWELLTLVSDSADEPAAQVRGLSTARVLYFNAAAGWSLEAEIDGDQVTGQLLDHPGDPEAVEITLENGGGGTWTTGLDEVGFFVMRAGATGSVRFVVTIDGRVARSRWLDL